MLCSAKWIKPFLSITSAVILLYARLTSSFAPISRFSSNTNLYSALDSDMIPPPSLRQRLLFKGAKSYGPMVMSDSPLIAEMLSAVGYQHVVIDYEHSPAGLHNHVQMMQAVGASRSPVATEPIVRLPSSDPDAMTFTMKKVLDGMRLPGGVLVPMVEDADSAQRVVRATRYPQDGIRGCAAPFVRATGWGTGMSLEEYAEQCQKDLLVLVQVESSEAVEKIPEIASVDGVDGIFIGPFDLSASIGKMGQMQDPEVVDLIAKAESKVIAYNAKNEVPCILAGFRPGARSLKEMFQTGYQFVCGSVDMGMLRDAARRDMVAANKAMSINSTKIER